MNRSLLLVLAGAVAVVVLFLVFRSNGNDSSSETTTAAATTTQARTTQASTATAPTHTARSGPTVIAVAVRNARPVGGIKHAQVKQGTRVALVVTSPDTTDEVHLHGYDLHSDIENGKARIDFRATIAGRFEAELESHGVQILDLEVTP